MTTPFRFHPGYRDGLTPAADDLVVAATPQLQVAVTAQDRLPTYAELSLPDLRVIGMLDGAPVWAGPLGDGYMGGREHCAELALRWPEPMGAVAARGAYDVRWRHTHRFCGECGGPMVECAGFATRRCGQCETVAFVPLALSPAVLVAIARRDEVLLVKHTYTVQHMWTLVAGFVEPGETMEQAVAREVWEEVGLAVTDVRYVTSQAWSQDDPGVLLLGFVARCGPGAEVTVDEAELAQARWFDRAALAAVPAGNLPRRGSIVWQLLAATGMIIE